MVNRTDEELEEELFGDREFKEALPQTRVEMAKVRVLHLFSSFLYGAPNPEEQEKAVFLTRRLAELTKEFVESTKTNPPRRIGSNYYQR